MRSSLRLALASAFLLSAALARAQTQSPPLPQNHIPPSVVMEVRMLERSFDLALANDCAPEKCFSKGCIYVNHATVDLPRSGSLPGLGTSQGPGSVPPEEYLTEARCEFTHEKSVSPKDVQALTHRLEQRLSRGWLRVSVAHQNLEPISPSLKDSPTAPEPKSAVPPSPPPAAAEEKPVKWDGAQAIRELWLALLPHFAWMIAIVMATFATLMLIWGGRRLGRETIEEKMLAAQLAAGTEQRSADQPRADAEEPPAADAGRSVTPLEDESAFVAAQQQLWSARIGEAELSKKEGMVVELLREWLKSGEFDLLAKAIFVFGERLSLAFESEGELAVRKVEFADYMKTVDEKALISDAEFFRRLNQHALSASLLLQDDVEVYRSLREEFGASGVLELIENLSPRHGALLFALVPNELQHDIARMMSPEQQVEVADQLLVTNRISREDTAHVFDALNAARRGQPLPPTPDPQGLSDRGREFDAAGALSVLLPRISAAERAGLFSKARARSGGVLPRWYEDILYADMLLKLPETIRKDLLLEVDVRGLAGWCSVQAPAWRETFLNGLSPSLQNAVRASFQFGSRADQLRLARRGHNELVNAVKKQVAQGKVLFAELVV